MQFSLDRKRRRHKQNQYSASDSVGLIFTRSYRSTLLIANPTTTPSLVKTLIISALFEGSISDKELVKRSGLFPLLEPGDQLMADKGFDIKDILEPIGCEITSPAFKC